MWIVKRMTDGRNTYKKNARSLVILDANKDRFTLLSLPLETTILFCDKLAMRGSVTGPREGRFPGIVCYCTRNFSHLSFFQVCEAL